MQLKQIFLLAKNIHRWLLWFVTILGTWMMLSGYLMHKELEGESLFSTETMSFMRFWHNKTSTYFLVLLSLQMVTGLAMWMIPKILSSRAQSKIS